MWSLNRILKKGKMIPNGRQENRCTWQASTIKKRTQATEKQEKTVENLAKFEQLVLRVENAVQYGKIFAMDDSFDTVRNILLKRGWIEKFPSRRLEVNLRGVVTGKRPNIPFTGGINDVRMMSDYLHDMNVFPSFLWTTNRKEPFMPLIMNRFPNAPFTNKVGLCESLQETIMLQEPGVSRILSPRSYVISKDEGKDDFINDFRLTACFSLLKWILEKYDEKTGMFVYTQLSEHELYYRRRTCNKEPTIVPINTIEIALENTRKYIRERQHEDIDSELTEDATIDMKNKWTTFIKSYYSIVHNDGIFEYIDKNILKAIVQKSREALKNVEMYFPYLKADGLKNIWIIKPGDSCRGQGIKITKKMQVVLQYANFKNNSNRHYVVQKYIEKPLLIFDTKFDIRQWFIVTNWDPLTIWLFRDSYLRFCSNLYSLSTLDESTHLCNNAVQCRYEHNESCLIPKEKMWACSDFQNYLCSLGYPDVLREIIYPRMCEGIIGALLASQDKTTNRKFSFELFGADFMITEDFMPWLIEINASPCMLPTTSITRKMCKECCEDMIKVVIDRRRFKYCDTGKFTMIFKENANFINRGVLLDLRVYGTAIPKKATWKQKQLVASQGKKGATFKTKPKLEMTNTGKKPTQGLNTPKKLLSKQASNNVQAKMTPGCKKTFKSGPNLASNLKKARPDSSKGPPTRKKHP